MKNVVLLILVPIFMLSSFKSKKEPLKIGSIIPRITAKMENYGGAKITLHDAGKENGLLVIFSCNTCPTVVQNHSRIVQAASYAIRNRVGVIIVNSNEGTRDKSDSPEMMRAYAEELGYRWYYAVDRNSRVANEFGANFNPECYLFDRIGRLVYKGAIDDNPRDEQAVKRRHVEEAIREYMSGEKISIKETEPVGCPIKRK